MGQPNDFRVLMDDYFNDIQNLTRAAMVMTGSDLAPDVERQTLYGLIEMLDKLAKTARQELDNQDRQRLGLAKPSLVEFRS